MCVWLVFMHCACRVPGMNFICTCVMPVLPLYCVLCARCLPRCVVVHSVARRGLWWYAAASCGEQ